MRNSYLELQDVCDVEEFSKKEKVLSAKNVKEEQGVYFKMNFNIKRAEDVWKKAIKLLNSDCPEKSCEWCDGR